MHLLSKLRLHRVMKNRDLLMSCVGCLNWCIHVSVGMHVQVVAVKRGKKEE